MRAVLFIGVLLSMLYVAYLQMNTVKEHDLAEPDNRISETQNEVNKIINDYEDKLNNTMP